MLRSRGPGFARGLAVGLMVSALVAAGATPAVAAPGSTGVSGSPATVAQQVAPDRTGAAGPAAVAAALARDLGLTPAEATELRAAAAAAVALDARLRDRLGAAFGGSWFDHGTGALTVAVTDAGAARLARSAGARARLVTRGEPALTAIAEELDGLAQADPAVLAGALWWSVDAATDQVVMTVREGAADRLTAVVARYGDAVRVEESRLAPRPVQRYPFLDGGIPYNACSTGFNLQAAGVGYVLTAGHCGTVGTLAVAGNGVLIGPFVESRFPTFDDALIRVDNPVWVQGPWVWTYPGFVTVTGVTDAPVGTPVCKSGATTGLTCGVVTAKNVTVVTAQGPVFGLTQHNACAEPGDSGGSNLNVAGGVFAEGVTSVAVLSGGRCLGQVGQPSISWYFPIVDSLAHYCPRYGC